MSADAAPASRPADVQWERFDAVLFDLDGVLTDTASLHAACWKQTFDELLHRRSDAVGEPFVPFDIESDYRRYVDGKRRLDGVRSFLASRSITLPSGDEDRPAPDTVHGVGDRKNELMTTAIASGRVRVYDDGLTLARRLQDAGKHTAVVSSSANCRAVLDAVGLNDLFEIRVDGQVATALGLPGKPAPDTFLHAAALLGVEPARTVVIEDARSGVEAGRRGGFGLVVGLARHDDADGLLASGADMAVATLDEFEPPSG